MAHSPGDAASKPPSKPASIPASSNYHTPFQSQSQTQPKITLSKLWTWTSKLSLSPSPSPAEPAQPPQASASQFWPSDMAREIDKAARVIKSFADNGFSYEEGGHGQDNGVVRSVSENRKIPTRLLQRAHGIIILTAMRSGLWVSGAGGSGIIVAKTDDGVWSKPAAVLLHSSEVGFLLATNSCDCIVLINTRDALEAVLNPQWSFETSLTSEPGPIGDENGQLTTALPTRAPEAYTYVKSQGFYSHTHMDGLVLERSDINARYYGRAMSLTEISFNLQEPPRDEERLLMTALTAISENIPFCLPPLCDLSPAPSDLNLVKAKLNVFGVPDVDDPDPFGVLALEKEGISLRDTATSIIHRPNSEEFQFRPRPTSPIYPVFAKAMLESPNTSRRNSHRLSYISTHSRRRSGCNMVETSTQTDSLPPTPTFRFNGIFQTLQEAKLGSESRQSSAQHSRTSTLDVSSLMADTISSIHTISEEREDDCAVATSNEDVSLISLAEAPEDEIALQEPASTLPPCLPPLKSLRLTTPVELERTSEDVPTETSDEVTKSDSSDFNDSDYDSSDFSSGEDDSEDEEVAIIHQAPIVAISAARVKVVEVRVHPPAPPPRNPERQGGIGTSPELSTAELFDSQSISRSVTPDASLTAKSLSSCNSSKDQLPILETKTETGDVTVNCANSLDLPESKAKLAPKNLPSPNTPAGTLDSIPSPPPSSSPSVDSAASDMSMDSHTSVWSNEFSAGSKPPVIPPRARPVIKKVDKQPKEVEANLDVPKSAQSKTDVDSFEQISGFLDCLRAGDDDGYAST